MKPPYISIVGKLNNLHFKIINNVSVNNRYPLQTHKIDNIIAHAEFDPNYFSENSGYSWNMYEIENMIKFDKYDKYKSDYFKLLSIIYGSYNVAFIMRNGRHVSNFVIPLFFNRKRITPAVNKIDIPLGEKMSNREILLTIDCCISHEILD